MCLKFCTLNVIGKGILDKKVDCPQVHFELIHLMLTSPDLQMNTFYTSANSQTTNQDKTRIFISCYNLYDF